MTKLDEEVMQAIERLNTVFYDLSKNELSKLTANEKGNLIAALDYLSVICDYSFETEPRARSMQHLRSLLDRWSSITSGIIS